MHRRSNKWQTPTTSDRPRLRNPSHYRYLKPLTKFSQSNLFTEIKDNPLRSSKIQGRPLVLVRIPLWASVQSKALKSKPSLQQWHSQAPSHKHRHLRRRPKLVKWNQFLREVWHLRPKRHNLADSTQLLLLSWAFWADESKLSQVNLPLQCTIAKKRIGGSSKERRSQKTMLHLLPLQKRSFQTHNPTKNWKVNQRHKRVKQPALTAWPNQFLAEPSQTETEPKSQLLFNQNINLLSQFNTAGNQIQKTRWLSQSNMNNSNNRNQTVSTKQTWIWQLLLRATIFHSQQFKTSPIMKRLRGWSCEKPNLKENAQDKTIKLPRSDLKYRTCRMPSKMKRKCPSRQSWN